MRRFLTLGGVVLALSAWWSLRSQPVPTQIGSLAEPGHFLVCPGGETGGGFRSELGIAASSPGPFSVSLPATQLPSQGGAISPAGGGALTLNDIGEVGSAPSLVEMPTSKAGAVVLTRSGVSLEATGCGRAPAESLVIAGGSTRIGESLRLVVVNPFAVDAEVELAGSSEVGIDISPDLERLRIPGGAETVVDLERMLPSRASLSLRIDAVSGRVAVAARQSGGDDVAGWEAVVPAVDWFLPIPAWEGSGRLVVASAGAADAAIRIDRYGPDGEVEAVVEDTVRPFDQLQFELTDLVSGIAGLRVSATEPVAVTLLLEEGPLRAAANGSSRLAGKWLLPGLGVEGARVTLLILNPSETRVRASIGALEDGARSRTVEIPAGGVTAMTPGPLPAAGAVLVAEGEVAAAWTAETEGALAYQVGTVADG